MKTLFLLFILIGLSAFAVEPSAPLAQPVVTTTGPESFQAKVMVWIAVATVLATPLTGFVVFVITKIGEIKRALAAQKQEVDGRLDRQSDKLQDQQKQITQVALSSPPPVVIPVTAPTPEGK